MTQGRRKNQRLEQRRRRHISEGLKRAITEGRRKKSYQTAESIEKMRLTKKTNPHIPWNKGKTVEKDGVYSSASLKKMTLGQRRRFRTMSEDEVMKVTENMRRAQLLRWQRYREKQEERD